MFTPEKRVIRKYDREPVRVTDEHIDKIMRWVTPRDIKILRLLIDHPFLTIEQIEMMVFTDLKPSCWRNKATERIRRLYHAHCLDRWFPPQERDAGSTQQHVVLDRAGALVLARSLGYDKSKIRFQKRNYIPQTYQHTLKIYDFKAMLHVLNRQLGVIDGGEVGEILNWKMEEQTKLVFYKEGEGRRTKDWLVPDALCIYKYRANGAFKIFFLEADNSTEDLDTLKHKIKDYISCYRGGEWREQTWAKVLSGMFPAVTFLLHEKEKAIELARYARTLQSNIRFLFTTYDTLTTSTYKDYGNKLGKTRKILQEMKVNILEPIWLSNREENLISL